MGQEARSFRAGQHDRGSIWVIGLGISITFASLISAPVLNHLQIGQLERGSSFVGGAGLGAMVVGIALRYWACKALGEFYTRTLLVKTKHRVIEDGPYRIIRHPGYLGTILMFIGGGLATANWIAPAVITVVLAVVYTHRIRIEESMLQAALGERYRAYMGRSWRLIPLIY